MNKLNNKGFTLVELLSVIVLLGLILVIVGTKGLGVFDNAKVAIDNQNKEAIIEGAKVLLVEIENCDEFILGDLKKVFDGISKCEEIQNQNLSIQLSKLIENNYITNSGVREIYESYPNLYVEYTYSDKKYEIKGKI